MYIVILHVYHTFVFISSFRQNTLYGFDRLTVYQERELCQKWRETSMPIVTKNQYHLWLKSAANMRLSSDASVLRITYEGLTKFQSFMDFDWNSIESLSKACSKDIDGIINYVPNGIAAKNNVTATSTSTISIQKLFFDTNDVKYYTAIGQMPDFENMHYVNVIGEFKTDYYVYSLKKKKTLHKFPL